MKNIQSIYCKTGRLRIVAFLILLSFSACRKYIAEFEYQPINDVVVKDVDVTGTVSLKIGDTLRLNPQISQSQLANAANLSYLWTSYESGDVVNAPKSELSKEKNLVLPIKSPLVLGKLYLINFQVLDKTTGVSSYKQYRLSVVNEFNEGWIIVEDRPEGADFSMLLPDRRVIRNIFTTINGRLPGKALRVEISSGPIMDDVSPNRRKMYMVTEDAATELDYLTFSKTYDFKSLFFKAPEVIKPSYMNWFQQSGIGSIINDGKLHINVVGGFPGAKKWATQLLAPQIGPNYKLAPFVANGLVMFAGNITDQTPQYYTVVVYDQISKRFYAGINPIMQLSEFPAVRSTVFNMNNVGMEMLYMDLTTTSFVYNAVMKDAANDYYFLQFRTTFTNASPVITLAKNKLTAPNIQNFSSASTSFASQHMFYSVGNQIYRYELLSNTSKLQYTFPANEKIMQVRCVAPLGNAGNSLGVATWDGVEGRFYRFPINTAAPNAFEISTYDQSYGGFGKIVDIKYKN